MGPFEILQRDDEEAENDQTDSGRPLSRNDLADQQEGPDLGKKGSGTADGVNKRKILNPIGFDKADKVDGFEKAGEDDDPPQSERSLKDESGKDTQGKEDGEIKEAPKEENPEEKRGRPVSPLHGEIP